MEISELAFGLIIVNNAFNLLSFLPLDYLGAKVVFNSVQTIHEFAISCLVAVVGIVVIDRLYRKREHLRISVSNSEAFVIFMLFFFLLLYSINNRSIL